MLRDLAGLPRAIFEGTAVSLTFDVSVVNTLPYGMAIPAGVDNKPVYQLQVHITGEMDSFSSSTGYIMYS